MKLRLKEIKDQVIVITGASSGIGLATAQMAAARGARVVLTSRDAADLERAVDAIRSAGGEAISVTADVADRAALEAVVERAMSQFGGIDTWVNNAGVSIYGTIEQVPVEDAQRLFQTNYFGVVNGSLAALPHLKRRAAEAGPGHGAALINIGSVVSDTPIPLQGHYSASKHAVKGFTDTLRMELEKEGAPISVTLVQPSAIDTPYPEHAANYLGVEPKHAPPVYAPEIVARAILTCAERPQRDVKVGSTAHLFAATEAMAPRLGDRMKEAMLFEGSKTDRPDRTPSTLYEPHPGDGRVHGRYPGHVRQTSLSTWASLYSQPLLVTAAAFGLGAALALYNRRGHDGYDGHAEGEARSGEARHS